MTVNSRVAYIGPPLHLDVCLSLISLGVIGRKQRLLTCVVGRAHFNEELPILDSLSGTMLTRAQLLVRHLDILVGRLEIIVIILIFVVVCWVLSSSLGEVNLGASSTTASVDNVVQINFFHTVFLFFS